MVTPTQSQNKSKLPKQQSGQDFVVERVLDVRGDGSNTEYLLQWVGYTHAEDSWEPAANCHCPDLIEEFERKRARSPQIAVKSPHKTPNKAIPASKSVKSPQTNAATVSKPKRGLRPSKKMLFLQKDDPDAMKPKAVYNSDNIATMQTKAPQKTRPLKSPPLSWPVITLDDDGNEVLDETPKVPSEKGATKNSAFTSKPKRELRPAKKLLFLQSDDAAAKKPKVSSKKHKDIVVKAKAPRQTQAIKPSTVSWPLYTLDNEDVVAKSQASPENLVKSAPERPTYWPSAFTGGYRSETIREEDPLELEFQNACEQVAKSAPARPTYWPSAFTGTFRSETIREEEPLELEFQNMCSSAEEALAAANVIMNDPLMFSAESLSAEPLEAGAHFIDFTERDMLPHEYERLLGAPLGSDFDLDERSVSPFFFIPDDLEEGSKQMP
ncbi:hypothetical protein L596_000304 [Steinernema carpocapsae]|uniref:Chromo domain-containing protein n=1 Tax=Steinernema carpocapsae TaxID=34508 RepID=A0A4U8UHY7_STECR|nr:hypothetical protein L596_000304 [Steinernema carpocapsae]